MSAVGRQLARAVHRAADCATVGRFLQEKSPEIRGILYETWRNPSQFLKYDWAAPMALRRGFKPPTPNGCHMQSVRPRDTFSSLHHLWRDDQIPVRLKISLYNSLAGSKLVYCNEAWILDNDTTRKINGFNARCLHRITNQGWSSLANWANSVSDRRLAPRRHEIRRLASLKGDEVLQGATVIVAVEEDVPILSDCRAAQKREGHRSLVHEGGGQTNECARVNEMYARAQATESHARGRRRRSKKWKARGSEGGATRFR